MPMNAKRIKKIMVPEQNMNDYEKIIAFMNEHKIPVGNKDGKYTLYERFLRTLDVVKEETKAGNIS